jgi:hypothetical protein
MRTNASLLLVLAFLATIASAGGCRQKSLAQRVEGLPELPAELRATLDPTTLATRVPTSFPPREHDPNVAAAPCCARTDTKHLQVRFPYTKCGPLRDFIVASFGDAVLLEASREGTTAHKLRALTGARLLEMHVCVTSHGPWNARLIEDRACSPYTPVHTLVINARGDMIQFVWNGPVGNHPPDVQLVSCRQVSTTESACNPLSGCACLSSACPATEPCTCNLDGQW